MLSIQREGILIEPTSNDFEEGCVLNPAVIREGEYVHLLYRAVRRGNHSTIGYCRLHGPLTIEKRNAAAILSPETSYESQGIEDPRIVKIDDLYYLSYCAYDGVNAMGAVATSKDLVNFERHGLIHRSSPTRKCQALFIQRGLSTRSIKGIMPIITDRPKTG